MFCYTFGMKSYDEIWGFAEDHHGIITSNQAVKLGVGRKNLVAMAQRGTLDRIGHGVYMLSHHVPAQNDVFAMSVAVCGENAYLRGASVVALLNLAATNPGLMYVGAPGRVRRNLPSGYILQDRSPSRTVEYDGIPSQPIGDAILSALADGSIESDRLEEAAEEAVRQGLLSDDEYGELMGKLRHG
jgi:hypothetical protein